MTNTKPLTRRQREILQLLVTTTDAGQQATRMEIAAAFGIRSSNGIAEHLELIEAKGYIRVRPRISRCIEILFDHTGRAYEMPAEKLRRLCEALGCATFREAMAVALGRRVA